MTRPIHRETPDRRRELLAPLVGRDAVVFIDTRRDGEAKPVAGRILGVAWATTGQSDELLVEMRAGSTMGGLPFAAISLATIAGVLSGAGEVGRIPNEVQR